MIFTQHSAPDTFAELVYNPCKLTEEGDCEVLFPAGADITEYELDKALDVGVERVLGEAGLYLHETLYGTSGTATGWVFYRWEEFGRDAKARALAGERKLGRHVVK